MDCASIIKRGYLYDKKMGILPVTVVSLRMGKGVQLSEEGGGGGGGGQRE